MREATQDPLAFIPGGRKGFPATSEGIPQLTRPLSFAITFDDNGDTQQDVLAEEKRLKRYLCVSLEPRPRKLDEVTVFPYQTFLQALWAGEYL